METGFKTAHINGKVRVSRTFLFLFFSVLTIYEFIIINFWVIFFLSFFKKKNLKSKFGAVLGVYMNINLALKGVRDKIRLRFDYWPYATVYRY